MKKIEILVAVRNESQSIKKFVDEINNISIEGVKISVLFLEDGSNDDTLQVLRTLSKKSEFVKYYSLKNDFGQYFALFFGITKSDADAIITMDVDGGHPLYIIKEMINEYLNGYNVVQGHRVQYKQKEKYRAIVSYLYNLFFLIFIGLNIIRQNSIFRLMDRKAYEIFRSNFLLGYSLKTNYNNSDGIRIKYIPYDSPERQLGVSKYDFFRLSRLSVKVALSQLSKLRFSMIISFFIVLGIIILSNTIYSCFICCSLLILFLIIPYWSIRKKNPLSQIMILETEKTI